MLALDSPTQLSDSGKFEWCIAKAVDSVGLKNVSMCGCLVKCLRNLHILKINRLALRGSSILDCIMPSSLSRLQDSLAVSLGEIANTVPLYADRVAELEAPATMLSVAPHRALDRTLTNCPTCDKAVAEFCDSNGFRIHMISCKDKADTRAHNLAQSAPVKYNARTHDPLIIARCPDGNAPDSSAKVRAIAEYAGLDFNQVNSAVQRLVNKGSLSRVKPKKRARVDPERTSRYPSRGGTI